MITFPGGVRQKRNFRRGGGVHFVSRFSENPEGRGVIGKIPSVGGYGYFLELHIVCFQKISRPLPRRELEIPEERGGRWPRKFRGGEGFRGQIHFQMVGKIIDFS